MDEHLLVRQVIEGNESAYRVLMGKYERLVFHMVSRVVVDQHDREELCQDVFVKVYEKLSTFNFQSKLSTWIATIAFRSAVNFSKKKKLNLEDIDNLSIEFTYFDNEMDVKEQVNWVHHLIDKLPIQYKTVLTLHYIEGFNYQEIIEIMGMPEGTVKNYIHRAKQKLKEIIEKQTKTELKWT